MSATTRTTSPAAARPTTAVWDATRLGLGANLLDGSDTIHGDSTDDAAGDDDAVVGDNGWVTRPATTQVGPGPDGVMVDIATRDVQMIQTKPAIATFGDDHVLGNGGHDELYGQAGNDAVEGGWGSDAVLGDLGTVTTDLLGWAATARARPLAPSSRRSRSYLRRSASRARCSAWSSSTRSTTPRQQR